MTPTPETTPVAETLSFGEQSAEAFAATIESTTDTRVAELEAQIAELKDQFLRARAEQENQRRRATEEVQSAHKFAVQKLATELLPCRI